MAKGYTPNHTACRKGTKVLIKFRDGTQVVDKFVERKGGTIFLEKTGRVTKKQIRSFSIYKPKK